MYFKATRINKDLALKDQIFKVLELNPSYGHKRIALALGIGKKRARRVMKLFNIKPYKRKARWSKKKDYGNPDSGYPNLIKGSCQLKPNLIFAGDFTRLIWNPFMTTLKMTWVWSLKDLPQWESLWRSSTKLSIITTGKESTPNLKCHL